MTISNGSTITASDLNGMCTTALSNVQADNARLPLGHEYTLNFNGLIDTTASNRRMAAVYLPCDCFLETVTVRLGIPALSSTATVTITNNADPANAFPVTLTGTLTALFAITRFQRVLYDGTGGNVASSYMAANRAVRVYPQGSKLTVTVSTTSTSALPQVQVTLLMRQYFSR